MKIEYKILNEENSYILLSVDHVTSPSTSSVNNTNSLSPSTQNTTLMRSLDVEESLEWQQFLTNQTDFSSKIEHEWQNESSPFSKTTALHCVAPESITASNIEWNKFTRAFDDNITTTFDSDSSEGINRDLSAISCKDNTLLNSARYFNDEVTDGFRRKRLYLNASIYKDNLEPSAIKFSNITSANESSKVTQGNSSGFILFTYSII
ncbi:hypothetical protein C1645_172279 [Glomus cerebriforme]|uniref:Uncharacterized protein n=1 Tax=Glomus cerebriforme TaxID=658196 RepID=A0A397TT56_9GLOM|nr:hypothetical protein C1645_172279 [Glomus cerebriforme]